MFTIYRLENNKGNGPYRKDNDLLSKHPQLHNDNEHPVWEEANNTSYNTKEFFACPSLEKLLQWFEGYIAEAYELGFKVYQIEVKKIRMCKSNKQCLYKKENIINSKTIKFTELCNLTT